MRKENWPEELFAEIERQGSIPFAWGKSDCFTFVAACVEAMTGEDISKGHTNYKTPAEGHKLMKVQGFRSLEKAYASRFKEVPVSEAQRGDIGIVKDRGMTSVIFLGATVVGKDDQSGVVHAPRSIVSKAFRVE